MATALLPPIGRGLVCVRVFDAPLRIFASAFFPYEGKDAVRRLLALRARDSRLGYEASNHYFYTVNDLIEKCLQLDWLEGKMEEQTHGE